MEGERRRNRGRTNEFMFIWREKKAAFDDQERKLKLWEEAVANLENRRNRGHKRLNIGAQRTGFMMSRKLRRMEELGKHIGVLETELPRHRKMQFGAAQERETPPVPHNQLAEVGKP